MKFQLKEYHGGERKFMDIDEIWLPAVPPIGSIVNYYWAPNEEYPSYSAYYVHGIHFTRNGIDLCCIQLAANLEFLEKFMIPGWIEKKVADAMYICEDNRKKDAIDEAIHLLHNNGVDGFSQYTIEKVQKQAKEYRKDEFKRTHPDL
jgi:hypothetical protein